MSIEKEIRIAKLQVMWTIAVVALGLYNTIRYPIDTNQLWDLLFMCMYVIVWYLGALSIRQSVEKELEE